MKHLGCEVNIALCSGSPVCEQAMKDVLIYVPGVLVGVHFWSVLYKHGGIHDNCVSEHTSH